MDPGGIEPATFLGFKVPNLELWSFEVPNSSFGVPNSRVSRKTLKLCSFEAPKLETLEFRGSKP